jgi:hypothetical protein
MILEYEVSLWIQIAPLSADGSLPSPPPPHNSASVKYCDLFPLHFLSTSTEIKEKGGIELSRDDQFYNLSYSLSGFSRQLSNGTMETIFDPPPEETEACQDSTPATHPWVPRSQSVEHLWFHQWDDFSIPERRYDNAIDRITTRAAEYLSQNKTVVISCFSGRGRSGTLAAIVGAKVFKLQTISEVVDLIVRMRRSRDGLVETPQQLNYILTLLNRYTGLSLEDDDGAAGGGEGDQQEREALWLFSLSLDVIVTVLISLSLVFGMCFL